MNAPPSVESCPYATGECSLGAVRSTFCSWHSLARPSWPGSRAGEHERVEPADDEVESHIASEPIVVREDTMSDTRNC